MDITVKSEILFPILDALLARWKAKQFPYNKKDAIIPQTVIPQSLRADKHALALFYFYLCIYMRGGIESLQAFNALLRLREDDPWLFDPFHAHMLSWETVQPILKQYVGWDSESASKSWVQNSRQLVTNWGGNPLNVLHGLRDYDEALLRMTNKHKKKARELLVAGKKDAGFRGFQPKMVSMLLYFYDWEGWLKPRFLYPAPADFHNFRLGLTTGSIILHYEADHVRAEEPLSKPWRDACMSYLRIRKADPIEVADALWMFSLVMCGNSPLTAWKDTTEEEGRLKARKEKTGQHHFDTLHLPQRRTLDTWRHPRHRRALEVTCLRCPLLHAKQCSLAIPSRPYYRKGKLLLTERPQVERLFPLIDPDVPYGEPEAPLKEEPGALLLLPNV